MTCSAAGAAARSPRSAATRSASKTIQRAFQNEVNQISQQAGRRITTEQAHAAGLDNRVLAQLIAWSAVEAHANELGLALSDPALAEAMKNDQAFKGPDGKFNRLAFENVLDQAWRQRARLPAAAPSR